MQGRPLLGVRPYPTRTHSRTPSVRIRGNPEELCTLGQSLMRSWAGGPGECYIDPHIATTTISEEKHDHGKFMIVVMTKPEEFEIQF